MTILTELHINRPIKQLLFILLKINYLLIY